MVSFVPRLSSVHAINVAIYAGPFAAGFKGHAYIYCAHGGEPGYEANTW